MLRKTEVSFLNWRDDDTNNNKAEHLHDFSFFLTTHK